MTPRAYAAVLFLLVAFWFGAAAFTLLQEGYVSDSVLREISTYLVFSTHATAARDLGFLPISLPVLGYGALAPLLGPLHPVLPYVLGVVGTALLVLAAVPSIQRQIGRAGTLLMVVCVALNPIVLWFATAGGGKSIALFLFYGMCVFLCRIHDRHDLNAYVKFAFCGVGFLLADPTATPVCLAMLPWIPFAARPAFVVTQPLAFYLITCTPVAMTLCALVYLNWSVFGYVAPFVTPLNGGPGQDFPWNRVLPTAGLSYRMAELLRFLLYAVVFFPSVVMFSGLARASRDMPYLAIVLSLVTAPFLVLVCGLPYHPLDYLPYLAAPLLVLAQRVTPSRRIALLGVQILSVGVGWGALALPGWSSGHGWTEALGGTPVALYRDEMKVGQWITQRDRTTLLDPLAHYRVIAFCGHVGKLVFPPGDAGAIQGRLPAADHLLVTPPDSSDAQDAQVDRISQSHPDLWADGLPHYSLALEQGAYRIWERVR
ncbi:hypothetical protein [Gluconacetobacter diazotrophicus]|uniref:Putative membrane protein n=1 Tax=Gluconacetobacter diazotrophicus (strain ATCC 49037 / DSM 5601 / CCUG 37298 / CIP 103539 / LMG 7603 / PAl5) TaxID=272568 RepID=A9H4Q9_GLUDA|nr:hypothetical protein [Gluconacetobacter diazotrophicus]CAP57470.1 putative membrane protein [Gluconacetobacter diazotrophicus PA1 5]